jgi:predicted nucleotidyltransferase
MGIPESWDGRPRRASRQCEAWRRLGTFESRSRPRLAIQPDPGYPAVDGGELGLSRMSRRAEAARRAGLALTERVQSERHHLELIFVEHGVREAYLFGSVARGEGRPGSDVDIAVAGCPPALFCGLAARLERALALPLDLIDLDMAPTDFAAPIRQSGLRLYPPAAAAPSNPDVEGHDKG